ncbi:MAG TPA: AraC family transcriptional regulator [Spirochaetia bacterium]|nr:AraC family transcriptional regulator [Spirochaetia bacterium]
MHTHVQFQRWKPLFHFTKKGKHIIEFRDDFPVEIAGFRFPYFINLVPNYHDYLEISNIVTGTGVFHISNKEYQLAKHDLIVIGSDEVHTFLASRNTSLEILSVFFLPEVLSTPTDNEMSLDIIRPFYNSTKHVIRSADIDYKKMSEIMLEMYRLEKSKPRYYKLSIRFHLFELLLLLLLHYDANNLFSSDSPERSYRRQANIHRLNQVFSLVENNYPEGISLDYVAGICNMSKNYFCRFFREVTGNSFIDYLNKFRINKAKYLLLNSDLSITQISFDVGFNNLGYFFRVFRKYANLSPKEFIHENNSSVATMP